MAHTMNQEPNGTAHTSQIKGGFQPLGIKPVQHSSEMLLRLITEAKLGLAFPPQRERARQLAAYASKQLKIAHNLVVVEKTISHLGMARSLRLMAEEARGWVEPLHSSNQAMTEAMEALLPIAFTSTMQQISRIGHIELALQSAQDACYAAIVLYDHRYGITPEQWVHAAAMSMVFDTLDEANAERTGSSKEEQRLRGVVGRIVRLMSTEGSHQLMRADGTMHVIDGAEVIREGRNQHADELKAQKWSNLDAQERNEVRANAVKRNLDQAAKNGEFEGPVGQMVEKVGRLIVGQIRHEAGEARTGKFVEIGEIKVDEQKLIGHLMEICRAEGHPITREYAEQVVDFTVNGSYPESLFDEEGGVSKRAEKDQVSGPRREPNLIADRLWTNPDWKFIYGARVARDNGVLVEFLMDELEKMGVVGSSGHPRRPTNSEMNAITEALDAHFDVTCSANPWNAASGVAWEGRRRVRAQEPTELSGLSTINGVPVELIGLEMVEPIDPTAKQTQRSGTIKTVEPKAKAS